MRTHHATDTIVPVPDLELDDTIIDNGEVFRLLCPVARLHTDRLSRWHAIDAAGDMVPLDLPVSERRRVVGRTEG